MLLSALIALSAYIQLFIYFSFMVLETHMKLCVTEPDFAEKFVYIQNWENGPETDQKQGFLNLLKHMVINF